MKNDKNQLLLLAVKRLLRPLIKILLRNGVAYGAFAELVRKAYVDVAFEDYSGSSKRPTVSSVAALTGLTRKETKRLHELANPDTIIADERYNRSVRVISGWINDPLYLDSSGSPARLSLNGDDKSFASLVKKYSGDIPYSAMLSVLQAAKSVQCVDGHIELVQHAYIPDGDLGDKINILGADVAELIDTIDHNLISPVDELRFQRKVSNIQLASSSLPKFRKLSAKKAQKLLEELDSWLSKNEVDDNANPDARSHYVAMGIYYTECPSVQSSTGESS
jgi:hypothetical protein